MANHKYMGTSDEITTCEACGKKHLKRTVVLMNVETGAIVHYGSDCAAKAVGNGMSKKTVDVIADMMTTVQSLAVNSTSEVIAKAIWNKFGAGAELRGNVIKFYFGTFNMRTKQWV